MKILDCNNGIVFAGDEWRDLAWLQYGFFRPNCDDEFEDCTTLGESLISGPKLTFKVPSRRAWRSWVSACWDCCGARLADAT